MSGKQMVWLDDERCIGCGTCVEVCPVGAITMTNHEAHIDDGLCTGCGACVPACPEGAIQFVVEGEFVPIQQRAVPVVRQPSAIAEVVEPAAVAGGTMVLAQAARAIVRQVGRQLSQAAKQVGSSLGQAAEGYVESSSQPARGAGSGAGHRERHRRGRR